MQPIPAEKPLGPMWNQEIFESPRSMLNAWLEVAFEYRLGALPRYKDPVVIDLGANVGFFCIGALMCWKHAKVIAYEPQQKMFDMLVKNMHGLNVECHKLAVVHLPDGLPGESTSDLYHGILNPGCGSLRNIGEQVLEDFESVRLIDSMDLPTCDVMKIDIEGLELSVLEGYKHLSNVAALMVEVHDLDEYSKIVAIAEGNGLTLVETILEKTLRFMR